jgi:glycosyl transferase family 25
LARRESDAEEVIGMIVSAEANTKPGSNLDERSFMSDLLRTGAKPLKAGIRVISMPTAEARRKSIRRQLEPLTVPWGFFDAGYPLPRGFVYDPKRARIGKGRSLSNGEIGYYASSVRLWLWFLEESDLDVLCVLSDDVIIDPFFFENLGSVDFLMEKLDYLKLYTRWPGQMVYVARLVERHLVRFRKPTFGGQGYLITRRGAEMLLKTTAIVERPMDDEMDRYWVNKLPAYCLFPYPILEAGFPSTITPATYEQLSSSERLEHLAHRLANKASQTAHHLYHSFRTDPILKEEALKSVQGIA